MVNSLHSPRINSNALPATAGHFTAPFSTVAHSSAAKMKVADIMSARPLDLAHASVCMGWST